MTFSQALEYQSLYQKLKEQNMPIKVAYKLSKLNSQIQNEAKFYQKTLDRIIQRYAERDDTGNFIPNEDNTGILIRKDTMKECYEDINELQSMIIEKIDVSFTLEELEGLTLTPAELGCLVSLIIE